MESFFDILNSFWADEVVLRRILVVLTAATIFILGLGITILIVNLTNPVRRRLGVGKKATSAKSRLTTIMTPNSVT